LGQHWASWQRRPDYFGAAAEALLKQDIERMEQAE
jgi:hypothetical protein